jgi:MoaA/NifB/PqqE/SkfB family radical SAM enzyme
MAASLNLNIYNFRKIRQWPRRDFEFVRFDPNNDCNIQCVYCQNVRSKEIIGGDEFTLFLTENVGSVQHFQFGCRMEPTLDPRLVEMMHLVANSAAKPKHLFRLQTNGILLHRHDHGKMREAGLNYLTVSMDSVEPSVFKQLRGGASVKKVLRNISKFHRVCPAVRVAFITTVTSANIGLINELIEEGLNVGVSVFNLRQMVYHSENPVGDHSAISALAISDQMFEEVREQVQAKYSAVTRFYNQNAQEIKTRNAQVRDESLIPPEFVLARMQNLAWSDFE